MNPPSPGSFIKSLIEIYPYNIFKLTLGYDLGGDLGNSIHSLLNANSMPELVKHVVLHKKSDNASFEANASVCEARGASQRIRARKFSPASLDYLTT